MNRKRIAIISATGTAQKRTIPAIRARDLCDIVGIQGRSVEKIEGLAKQYSIPFHAVDVATLLDKVRPDFAFIGSPPFLHLEQIRQCAERKISVLCEKPLCLTVQEAKEIARLVSRSGIELRLAHHLRHQPAIAEVRDLVRRKTLGSPRRASIQWAFWVRDEAPSTEWKRDITKGGQHAFFDSGIHAIDLMLHIMPPPRKVAAFGVKSKFVNSFSTVSAIVDCGDAITELSTSQATRFPQNALTVDCESGTIDIRHALAETQIREIEITTTTGTETKAFDANNPYGEEVADFVRLLNGEQTAATTIDEAVRGVQILAAITDAVDTGKAIAL